MTEALRYLVPIATFPLGAGAEAVACYYALPSLEGIPWVMQYNKRDLPNVSPLDQMRKELNPTGVPEFEACATTGEGVFETLKAVAKGVLTNLQKIGA